MVRIDTAVFVLLVGSVLVILPFFMGVLGYRACNKPWDRKRDDYVDIARAVAWMGTPGAVMFLIGFFQCLSWLGGEG